MPATVVSPHFTLEEFRASQTAARMGLSNQPSAEHFENLKRTAGVIAALLDKLIENGTITDADGQQIIANARTGIGRFSTHLAYNDALSFLDVLSKKFPRA